MADLKEQRAVSEGGAALDALGATGAERFVDRVLVVRILDKSSFYCSSRTKLVFGTRFQHVRAKFKIARAKITISAYGVKLHTLDRGILQHTIRRAVLTRHAFVRINLPDHVRFLVLASRGTGHNTQSGQASTPETVSQEISPVDYFIIFCHDLFLSRPFLLTQLEADRIAPTLYSDRKVRCPHIDPRELAAVSW